MASGEADEILTIDNSREAVDPLANLFQGVVPRAVPRLESAGNSDDLDV
jgi:hypothetical protein